LKKICSLFRTGLLVLIPIFIVVFVGDLLWGILKSVKIYFVPHPALNFVINIAFYLAGIFLIGFLFRQKWLRELLAKICSKIPIVSFFSNSFLSNDYAEKMATGSFPEVVFRYAGVMAIGVAVNRKKIIDPTTLREVECLIVLGPPTAPVFATAQLLCLPLDDVIYTGKHMNHTAIMTASFGLNCQFKAEEFSKTEPSL